MAAVNDNAEDGADGRSGIGGGGAAQAASRSKTIKPAATGTLVVLRPTQVSDMSLQAPFFRPRTTVHRAWLFPQYDCNGCRRDRWRQAPERAAPAVMRRSLSSCRP